MINPLLILYWFFITGFILSALAVLYHLWFYQMNRKTALLISSLFVAGAVFLLAINFILAGQVPWSNFVIYFNF